MAKSDNPFLYFNSSREVPRLVMMLYVKFPLSLRNVEDLLAERASTSAMRRCALVEPLRAVLSDQLRLARFSSLGEGWPARRPLSPLCFHGRAMPVALSTGRGRRSRARRIWSDNTRLALIRLLARSNAGWTKDDLKRVEHCRSTSTSVAKAPRLWSRAETVR